MGVPDAREHLEYGLDPCICHGRCLEGSGGIRPARTLPSSAFVMAQAGGAAKSAAGTVRQVGLVSYSGEKTAIALGVDDLGRFCLRIVELVQFACANTEQRARSFISQNRQSFLEAAGQAEQRMCRWNGTRPVPTCDVSVAAQVMLRAARLKEGNVLHTGAGVMASEGHLEGQIAHLVCDIKAMACDEAQKRLDEAQKRLTQEREMFAQSIGVDAFRVDRSEGTRPATAMLRMTRSLSPKREPGSPVSPGLPGTPGDSTFPGTSRMFSPSKNMQRQMITRWQNSDAASKRAVTLTRPGSAPALALRRAVAGASRVRSSEDRLKDMMDVMHAKIQGMDNRSKRLLTYALNRPAPLHIQHRQKHDTNTALRPMESVSLPLARLFEQRTS